MPAPVPCDAASGLSEAGYSSLSVREGDCAYAVRTCSSHQRMYSMLSRARRSTPGV